MAVSLYPGMTTWTKASGAVVLRLHYEASPRKFSGERTYVPEIDMELSPWALNEYKKMPDKSLYRQEYEIDGDATLGQLIYHLDEKASVCDSFEIPPDWTRYMALDPHPSVPHAFLWVAVDPWGFKWVYRELWPSRVCFRYDGALLVGEAGPSPDDDNEYRIADYVETVKYLESAGNPQNRYKGERYDETIYARVIDYSARAWGPTSERPDDPTFQQKYEELMLKAGMSRPFFNDSKKDHQVGEELVNEALKPIRVMNAHGEWEPSSRTHIFGERCPELIYELKNNRRQQLTPKQAERMDPTGKPVEVRKHLTDDYRYIEMEQPKYVNTNRTPTRWRPAVPGIAY